MKTLLALLFCITNAICATFPLQITDSEGFTITLSKQPQRIVIGGGMWPLPSLIIMLDSSAKRIVYMPTASQNAIKHSFLADLYPEIAQIQAGNSENIEELLGMKPDLFICHSANIKICESMRKSGIPTIALSVSKWKYDSFETLKGWLEIIAPILGAEAKADKILDFTIQARQMIEAHIQSLDSASKPKALIIHRVDGKTIGAGGLFANYLLTASGGQNVLDSQSLQNLNVEELYKLNPDIIYINNFNSYQPQDILDSKLWQPLQAVKESKVYKFPLGSYRPFAPSVDLPILLLWLSVHNTNHKLDLHTITKNYYKEIFGITLTQSQILKIFNPDAQAGVLP